MEAMAGVASPRRLLVDEQRGDDVNGLYAGGEDCVVMMIFDGRRGQRGREDKVLRALCRAD